MPPTLEEISKIVGGSIEMVPNFHTEAIMYCNEEGKLQSLAPNFFVTNPDSEIIDCILGPVVMFGPNDGDGDFGLRGFLPEVGRRKTVGMGCGHWLARCSQHQTAVPRTNAVPARRCVRAMAAMDS